MALALCLASSHALSPKTICSRRAALYGAAAALSLPESVRAGQPSGADVSARLDAGMRAMDVLLRDWGELTIDCTYAEVPKSLLETKNKELLLEKAHACVENAGSDLGPPAPRRRHAAAAPASGCRKLRPASACQPRGPSAALAGRVRRALDAGREHGHYTATQAGWLALCRAR